MAHRLVRSTAAAPQAQAVRGLSLVLALIVGLQLLLAPLQRAGLQAHVHLLTVPSLVTESNHRSLFQHRRDVLAADADQAHHHSAIDHHAHDSARADVLQVADAADVVPAQAVKKLAFDLDLLLPPAPVAGLREPLAQGAPEISPSYRSHIEAPQPRPPRVSV